jgi:energy-coupling factor transport system permease protein
MTPAPLQRLCPAARILLLLVVFVWMLQCLTLPATLLTFAVGLLGVALARAGARVRQALPLLLVLGGMSLLIWTLFSPGTTPWLRLGPVTLTREAVITAVAMALRLDAMILAGLAFIAATPIEELRLGLCQLRVPYPMAFAVSLAFRLAPTFAATLATTMQAQQVRGHAVTAGGPLARLCNFLPLMIPVILLSLRNTDQLAIALSARGYGRPGPRTDALHRPWRLADTLILLLAVGGLVATLVWR